MSNISLVGQVPVVINSTIAVTATKFSRKKARTNTVRAGAQGNIGTGKGVAKFTFSITFAVPKAGPEFDLEKWFEDGATITYPKGAARRMLLGAELDNEDFSNDPEPGATDITVTGTATDEVTL